MRKSTAAVLLSAFAFPGAGHLYLRSYARGIGLIAISAAALIGFINHAWQEAEKISAQLNAEINAGGVIDLTSLIAQVAAAVDRIDRQPFTIATLILLICWVIGILDSYRIGKKFEMITTSA
jgi:hypothetical protein